jgi:O-antigen ligase
MAVERRRYRLPRRHRWAGEALEESPALPAQLLAVAAFLVLGASEGGFGSTNWPPAALFLLGLLTVTAIVLGAPRRPRPLVLAGLGLFAAYSAWSYLSITWAGVEADAWEGANRTASYLVVLALFSLWPPGPLGVRLLLGGFGLGVAGIGVVELLRADASAAPGGFFIDARFAEPAGYINANVALWTLGLFGCLTTAALARAHPAVRGAALAGAMLLGGLALLGQSRGWAIAFPLALLFVLLASPDRLRLALAGLALAAGLLPIRRLLLDVHDEYTPAGVDGLLADATAALLLVTVLAGLAGALWAFAERRVRLSDRLGRRLALGTGALLAAGVLLVGGVALASVDDPTGRVSDAWSEFKRGYGDEEQDASRFASGGSNRYDFWTVAWDSFADNPVRGLGAENFQRLYLKVGNSTEKPRYPHSLEIEVLSGLGLVGALLLAGALLALFASGARALAATPALSGAAAAGLGLFVYWFAHASVDWFWAFFGLTGPALAGLALAASARPAAEPSAAQATARTARRPRMAGPVAAGLVAFLLALSVTGPWLSAREVEGAAQSWREDPDAAFSALDRAGALNPLSTVPAATAGTIALRLGREDAAATEFRDVLRRDPEDAYAALELGLIAASRGREREAVRLLSRSLEQNPRDELVRGVLEDVRAGQRVDPARVNDEIARDALEVIDQPSEGRE